jgi:hypothetical protein
VKLREGNINSCVSRVGTVGVIIDCDDCGRISIAELTLLETRNFIALLQANLAIAARVRALPVPFVHEEGSA